MGAQVVNKDPLNGVPPSRHPFQFWILAAAVLGGFSTVFDIGQPPSLVALLPFYAVDLWGWITMISGLLGLGSIFLPDRITGLLLERIALWAMGVSLAIYGVVLLKVSGTDGLVLSGVCLSISIASVWRAHHVRRELQLLARTFERSP